MTRIRRCGGLNNRGAVPFSVAFFAAFIGLAVFGATSTVGGKVIDSFNNVGSLLHSYTR